jgi:hypothetical protein
MRHTVCDFNSPAKVFSAYFNGIVFGMEPNAMYARCGITKMCCTISGCDVTPEMMEHMLEYGDYTIGIGYNTGDLMDVQIPGILTGKVDLGAHGGETHIGAARREIREELGLKDNQFYLEQIARKVYRMRLTLDRSTDRSTDRERDDKEAVRNGDKIRVLFSGSHSDMQRIAQNISNVNSDNITHFIISPVRVSHQFMVHIREFVSGLCQKSRYEKANAMRTARYFIERLPESRDEYKITLPLNRVQQKQ